MKRRDFIRNSSVAAAGLTIAGPLTHLQSREKNICIVLAGGVRDQEWLPVLQSLETAEGHTGAKTRRAFDTESHISALRRFLAERDTEQSLIYTTAWADQVRQSAPGAQTESTDHFPGEESLLQWAKDHTMGTLYIIDHSTDAAHYSYEAYMKALDNISALAQQCISLAKQEKISMVELVPLMGKNSYANEILSGETMTGGLDHHPADPSVQNITSFTWTPKWQGLF